MFMRPAKAVLFASLIAGLSGCACVAPNPPPAAAAPTPVDPFAAQRPATASVGVVMPEAAWFPHSWDISTYVMRVTQFGVMPPLNGGVAFVGDSLTDWMRWNELFPDIRSRNFGIAGDTTVGLKARISQVVAAKPAKVVIEIGTNDVEFARLAPDAIVANIEDCVTALQTGVPGVKVVVESLLPRQPQFDAKVRAVNALLKAAADKHGVTYVDLYSAFVVNGRLDPSVTPDDIHLSGQGYLRWRDLIRPTIGTN
jgi:lysophospholipase L1-like esterase